MSAPIVGLHHVTAIASNPQRNLDFYTQTLGLRFVKRTINFDDPGSYHFYFGDDAGSPGTILTFFPWPGALPGSFGSGETAATAFSAPPESLDFWQERLAAAGIAVQRLEPRFGQEVLAFADPDGMRLEIVIDAKRALGRPSRFADVPELYAIQGFFGVTLAERSTDATSQVLITMGFHKVAEAGNRARFQASGGAPGSIVDLLSMPSQPSGRLGAGSVHHIAFRVPDDAAQGEWATLLARQALPVTPVQDRTYFHSIYFREPGGVLFEIATDPPGFTLDETLPSLGESLQLPEWLEPKRKSIEARLPVIHLHHSAGATR